MKPGSFSQLYIHIIFAVKYRENLLRKEIREQVFSYMSGIISGLKHKPVIINGVSDHVHILLGLNPSVSVSDTIHAIKRNSTLFINKEKLCKGKFAWQEGYAAFSYSHSQLDRVYHYILNQETHHVKKSFREEYVTFLDHFDIRYKPEQLFDFTANE